MDARIGAILRRPDGLFALLSRRAAPFEQPSPPGPDEPVIAPGDGSGPYVEELPPLADVPAALAPQKKLLLAAWGRLGAVRAFDAAVLADVLHVLANTLPDPEVDTRGLAPLIVDDPPPRPRPSAAHPRAFRGTKYQPPKPALPARRDLRPHLCVASDEERLLAELAPQGRDALRLLRGTPTEALLPAERGPGLFTRFGQNWPAQAAARVARLPAPFRRCLLWNLRGAEWRLIADVLAVYWSLSLEHDARLRRAIGRLMAIAPGATTVTWCTAIATQPPDRRAPFVEMLIESGAYTVALKPATAEKLAEASRLSSDAIYPHRVYYALETVRAGYGLDYALDGFRLANSGYERYPFDEMSNERGVGDVVARFFEAAGERGGDTDWHSPLTLWSRCSELPGLRDILSDLPWESVDGRESLELAMLLSGVVNDDLDPDAKRRKWQVLRSAAPSWLRIVAALDECYPLTAWDHLKEVRWLWDEPESLRRVLKFYERLLPRVCAPPFRSNGYLHRPLTRLTELPHERWGLIEQAPNASFLKLDRASRRDNDATLIASGLHTLATHLAEMTAAAFANQPAKLIATSRTLGGLAEPVQAELIRQFRAHPIIILDVDSAGLTELVGVLDRHGALGAPNPVPRRLRQHSRGERTLRPAQVDRDLAKLREQWPAIRLDVLHQLALRRLEAGIATDTPDGRLRHALLLLQNAEQNRRPLRKLLRAYLDGQSEYVAAHPLSRRWLAAHARIDARLWTNGIRMTRTVEKHGSIELRIERDLLEVLRLGTYFGTCLGLGGISTYSAAAVALDVNKQVAFARNARGTPVARQLLGLSEEERLVCYEVYPRGAPASVKAVFADYDRAFAAALGIEIYDPGRSDSSGTEAEVARILSRDYWDDGPWDLAIDTEITQAAKPDGHANTSRIK